MKKFLPILFTGALSYAFLFGLPSSAVASEHYRIVEDAVYDDASLYNVLCDQFASMERSRNAVSKKDEAGNTYQYVLCWDNGKTETITNHGNWMETIVEYPTNGDEEEALVKVRQIAYANGENYTTSYYLK